MGATEKYSRYRWKEGREKDLWAFVDGKVREGISVTAALKEYGKRHNMSWLTARWKYYQVRKREGAPVVDEGPRETPQVEMDVAGTMVAGPDDDFMACLSEFVSGSRESGEDVMTLMRGLARMAAMSRDGARASQDRQRRMEAMRGDVLVLREVRGFLSEWLSLPPVDRVASLKAFSDRLTDLSGKLAGVEERLAAQA